MEVPWTKNVELREIAQLLSVMPKSLRSLSVSCGSMPLSRLRRSLAEPYARTFLRHSLTSHQVLSTFYSLTHLTI